MPLSESVTADYRSALEAQRDDLAKRLTEAADKDAAALHRQLTAVLERLDRLPSGSEETKLDRIASGIQDELGARRAAAREPDSAGADRAGGGRSSRA